MKKTVIAFILAFAAIISAFSFNAFAAEMADGRYEVDIALWHSEDDKESMAADSVGAKAIIVVENGEKTMHITSGEMSMMGIKASLQELRIADKNGNFTDAKVESENSEGNPTGFYFTLPHTEKYITVKVNPHIAIMGNKDIGARIRVDYSTLKLIEAAVTTASQTTSENGEASESVESVSTAENQTTVTNADETDTTSESAQSEENGTQTSDGQSKEKNSGAIFVAVGVIAAVIILIAVKKKIKK